MVSSTSRLLLRILAALYALLGIILFAAPFWASQNFAWKVSPWVAMTIGGWCIGNAFFAWKSAKVGRWSAVYPNIVYLWCFGILQTLVLIFFRDKLLTTGPAAWLYLAVLAVHVLYSIVGIVEWYRNRPKIKPEGKPVKMWVRHVVASTLSFTIAVTIAMLIIPQPILRGEIMPEKISLFTLYAFAMFYISLAAAGLLLVKNTVAAPIVHFSQGAIAMMIPTTLAAIVFFAHVNFLQQVGAFLYIVIYLLIMAAAIAIVRAYSSVKE